MTTALLIIDPQVDFCDPRGALYVPGAERDMARLAGLVRRLTPVLDAVHVTLDSHHLLHVAHPLFWEDASRRPPAPFTIIRADEVAAGRWRAALPGAGGRALAYVRALERNGRYPLCIWPPHCLIGGPGHAVLPVLFEALLEWEAWERRGRVVDYIPKGGSVWTEHYSAIQADVPDPADPSTQLNTALVESLARADRVLVAGEAGSHCVSSTVRDLADAWGDDALLSRLVLLTDAVSPVGGFESLQSDFVRELAARGMGLSTTEDLSA